MKTKLLVILMICLFALPVMAAERAGSKSSSSKSAVVSNDSYIDVNNCLMFVTNHGNFARDLAGVFGQGAGTFYPYSTFEDVENGVNDITINFASGIWVGAVDSATGDTLIALSEYDSEFRPGVVIDPLTPSATFDPLWGDAKYRVFKISSDMGPGDPDYDAYMTEAVPQGAPTMLDTSGTLVPDMLGDQMLWSIYNDFDPAQHQNDAGATAPMGLEVHQTVFGFDREDPLGEVIFIRYKIYNKGTKVLNNTYFSVWDDPDVGDAGDDIVGCDTLLGLGFCYNADNNDAGFYGATPPALGYDFFQGPLVFTGDMADTGKGFDFGVWPGYVNLELLSFNKYINGTDPNDFRETYNYMQGLNADGSDYTFDGNTLKFVHTGDPVTGEGDIDFQPADRRFMQSTGNITFRPGDSVEIFFGQCIGRAADRLTAISVMKYIDQFAQTAYDLDFVLAAPPASPVVEATAIDGTVVLEWSTDSEDDPGDFAFEGYVVLQGESATGPWTRLATYDLNNSVATILDNVLDPLTGILEIKAVKYGTDAGVRHHYGTSTDQLTGLALHNHSTYYYRVEAYAYDVTATPKTLTSATVVQVTPQKPTAGSDIPTEFGEIIDVVHGTGLSDGVVAPFIVDPEDLTGHDYRVVFDSYFDAGLGEDVNYWRLENITLSTVVLDSVTNQSGDTDYEIVDGMLVKVTGPPAPGVKDWDIPNGTRRFTWAGADFGFEGFNGAIGWGGPGDTHGFGTNDPVPPADHVSVLLKLAPVDIDANFLDPADENMSYGYRYGRGFTAPPAQPEFAPFIIDAINGGYRYQDFEKSVPLSAWNMDVNPPTRMAVGYLENNAEFGRVDGKYFPGNSGDFDNIDGTGPREWLWIYLDDYSETPNAAYQGEAIADPMPILWWLTVNRRGDPPFEAGDEFLIIANHVNSPADTFTFSSAAPTMVSSGSEADLENIKTVPNPYYAYGPYDANAANRKIKFTNLPPKATIKIFNLGGDVITTIEHPQEGNTVPNEAFWNTLSENNIPIASGVYLYHIEAPGFGSKIGKMAIFTEIEVLDIF